MKQTNPTGHKPTDKTSQPQGFWSKAKAAYRRFPVLSNIGFIFLATIILVMLAMLFLNIWTHHGKTIIVPDVRELPYDQAAKVLADHGMPIEIADSIYDDTLTPGTVMESWPRPGAIVKPGREVYVTITSFQPRKVVLTMSLTGVSSRQAQSYLESLDIKNVRLVSVPSQYPDLVLGAKYEGKNITPGMHLPVNAVVTLEVGTVPNVTEVDIDDVEGTPVVEDNSQSQFYD